jgi:hypothetical protein
MFVWKTIERQRIDGRKKQGKFERPGDWKKSRCKNMGSNTDTTNET